MPEPESSFKRKQSEFTDGYEGLECIQSSALPPEIMIEVIEYVRLVDFRAAEVKAKAFGYKNWVEPNYRTLCALRCTCRTFESLVTPILFRLFTFCVPDSQYLPYIYHKVRSSVNGGHVSSEWYPMRDIVELQTHKAAEALARRQPSSCHSLPTFA